MFQAFVEQLRLPRIARQYPYALLVIATLAVGCGGLGAAGGAALGALFRPLGYSQVGELAVLSTFAPRLADQSLATVHEPEFDYLKSALGSEVAGFGFFLPSRPRMVAWPDGKSPANVQLVSSGIFQALGIAAHAGRTFRPADNDAAPDSERGAQLAILGWQFWSRMGVHAPPIGGTVSLDQNDYQVVGIMPPGFRFPYRGSADIWVAASSRWVAKGYGLRVVARFRPGVSLAGANAALQTALIRRYPGDASAKVFTALRRSALGSSWQKLLALLWGSLSVY
ncbi:MAG: ABC transporter permease, partial [Terriglobales bacterium]